MVNVMSAEKNTPTLRQPILVDPDACSVMCDGGGGALGHPQVWYSFEGNHQAVCKYCDRVFVKAEA